MRSTDWAKEEYDIGNKLPIKRNRKQYVSCFCYVSTDLFSRAVASQVSSALQSLTSVFGMGTGGPSVTLALTLMVHLQGFEPGTHWLRVSCSTIWAKGAFTLKAFLFSKMSIKNQIVSKLKTNFPYLRLKLFSSSFRSISIGQLNTLLCLHLRPIKLVVYKWP